MSYPQHDKIKDLNGANQIVGDFIEWLSGHGYFICQRLGPGNEGQDYGPTFKSRDNLIAEHFEIDEREFSREKDRMLDEFRHRSDEARMTG